MKEFFFEVKECAISADESGAVLSQYLESNSEARLSLSIEQLPQLAEALLAAYPLAREGRKTAADRLAELQALPVERRKAALAAIYREDPAIAKSVVGKLRESSKGRTEGDKLILSLGVEDGERARYLRGKLG